MNFSSIKGLHLNGDYIPSKDLREASRNAPAGYKKEVLAFAADFVDPTPSVTVHTSGSTGTPKAIVFEKRHLINSALSTLHYFNLLKGDAALLCLPVKYIAGKLMVVRALVGHLKLSVSVPTTDISSALESGFFKFAPFTPMQVGNLINRGKIALLNHIDQILLGGGPVSEAMLDALQNVPSQIYHSYGMAETLTHVAIRKLNGEGHDNWYTALKEVNLSVDNRQCLLISRADIGVQELQTNDIVELNGNKFIWLGRYDNLINSGGIKHLPEQLENKIRHLMATEFFFAGVPDDVLGQKLVLFMETEEIASKEELISQLRKVLDKKTYEMPREIVLMQKFERTTSGKIRREAMVRQLSGSSKAFKRLSV